MDDDSLEALEALADEVGDLKRGETVLGRALEEVFDGPLVRKLLARRAQLRRDRLDDKPGAAQDLKRLHDLSPSDAGISDDLGALYQELEDWRGMVQLYEDQILRGKDPSSRAELARKVARLWEERLDDPREAADAWRRVLRMKSGDPEATEGLERSKAAMIGRAKEPKPEPKPKSVPPEPKAPSQPPPADAGAPPPPAEGDALHTDRDASPAPLAVPPEAEGLVAADAGGDDDDDGPTLPPSASDPVAQAHAEDALAGLKPERPDIDFPRSDEVTLSASITELDESPTSSAPPPPRSLSSRPPVPISSNPPPPASAPPPAVGAPLPPMPEGVVQAVPDFSADEEYDRTIVKPGMADEVAGQEASAESELVDDEELIVDDDELLEDEP